MELPDQPHIDQIRTRLWRGREFGSVAVEWAACRIGMVSFGKCRSNLAEPLERMGTCEALRLAGEYELMFGRPALDNLLVNTIQDR